MLIATKGNRQTVIDEKEVKTFADQGYDVADEKGKVIAFPANKVVPYAEYAKLLAENEALKKKSAKGGSE